MTNLYIKFIISSEITCLKINSLFEVVYNENGQIVFFSIGFLLL